MNRFAFACLLLLTFGSAFSQTDTLASGSFERPKFPGGERAFSKFWVENFHVPVKYKITPPKNEGRIRFDVSKTGKIGNIRILQSLNPDLDASAVNAVRKMPDWKAAYQHGEPVDAYVEIPYFVLFVDKFSKPVTMAQRDSSVRGGGWMMEMWGGPMICTGDLGHYFRPLRLALGLEFDYRKDSWTIGLGWDVLAVSKVRQPFVLDNTNIIKDDRLFPVHVYLPVGYWFESTSKWAFCPIVAPTADLFQIDRQVQNNTENYTVATKTFFSVSAGLRAVKRTSIREFYNPVKHRMRYETTYVGARMLVNLFNFDQSGSTPLRGAAITLAVDMSGWLQPGKKGLPGR